MIHDTTAKSRPTAWLGAVALLLGGSVVGVFAGRWSASSGSSSRDPIAGTHDSAFDTAGLEDLRHSIDDLSRALRERPVSLVPPTTHSDSAPLDRQLALPDPNAFDRLANAIEHLDGILRSASSRSEATSGAPRTGGDTPMGPGYSSIAAMRARVVTIRGAHPDNVNDLVEQEFSSAHVLWTREEVINRYGLPMRTDSEGDHGLRLVYPGLDDPEHWDICFFTRLEPGSLVTGASIN